MLSALPISTCPVVLHLRPAAESDLDLVLAFVRELAEYERLAHMVVDDRERMRVSLFGSQPHAEVVIAEHGGQPAGFALFFHNFSTFLARPGLYLEDLFVRPAFRGHGVGKALLLYLAKLARERGCGRYEWSVLDWNRPAIDFYEGLGATPMNEWRLMRVTGEALDELGRRYDTEFGTATGN